MPQALILGGVAAAGTIGGALISSSAQSHAADQAQQSQQQATDAQLQLGQQSLAQQNALAQQSMGLNQALYNSNYDVLSPYASRGDVAGTQINAMLGLPKAPVMRSPLETATGGLAPIQLPPSATGATTGGTAPGVQSAPTFSQTPVNALAPPNPATIQQHAQQAIAMGADPAAVQARMASLGVHP